MALLTYVAQRLLHAVVVLWAAYTLTMLALFVLPSDPVTTMLLGGANSDMTVDRVQLETLRHELGFDQPLGRQYLTLLGRAVRGDFGESVQTGQPVSALLWNGLVPTAELATAALLIAVIAGSAVALISTSTRIRPLGGLLQSATAVGVSIPSFWLGLTLIELLSFRWRLLPAVGGRGLSGLILPAITLGIPAGSVIAQVFGRSLRSVLAEPFIVTAEAKGAGRVRIQLRHALRNAALPPLTLAGMIVGSLLGGAVVVETVFARNGLGRIAVDAVTNQDLPVVEGLVLLSAAVYVTTSLLVDLAYPLLDPRIIGTRGMR
ncbi:ABC transporter permease [Kribbella kalugense]|uniref:Peptide/nickel transport system permease protein n=1 Tax=Kribbella kalugense TaxID=2512221 RepID=A0A4R8A1V5_9ACTN|nr:ABC transporter permease [Kribbella kalugense]TDW24186.1 peptide/nickel transport system permease protein [Kribbella kalugense]